MVARPVTVGTAGGQTFLCTNPCARDSGFRASQQLVQPEFEESGEARKLAAVDSDFDGYDTAMAMAASGAGQIRAVPESQHALMSAAMLDAKRARMKVENDREALANRIARLQAEELRATKRIEQTVCAHTSCYDCTLLVSSSFVFFSHDCLL